MLSVACGSPNRVSRLCRPRGGPRPTTDIRLLAPPSRPGIPGVMDATAGGQLRCKSQPTQCLTLRSGQGDAAPPFEPPTSRAALPEQRAGGVRCTVVVATSVIPDRAHRPSGQGRGRRASPPQARAPHGDADPPRRRGSPSPRSHRRVGQPATVDPQVRGSRSGGRTNLYGVRNRAYIQST